MLVNKLSNFDVGTQLVWVFRPQSFLGNLFLKLHFMNSRPDSSAEKLLITRLEIFNYKSMLTRILVVALLYVHHSLHTNKAREATT